MRLRRTASGLLTAALVGAVCQVPTAAPAFAEGTAGLKATVTLEGERCKRTVVKMDADPYCDKVHTSKVGTENCIVSKSGQIMNVVVYVKDGLGDATFDPPGEKAKIDQHGCMYVPHVLTVQAGQEVDIVNSDDTLHNIHSFAEKQRPFNFAQPKKDMVKTVTFSRPEFVMVKCDVHPWMSAYVAVFTHPFHAVTDKDGVGQIAGLPAGEYTIGAWHEEFGELEQKITVADGETKDIALVYKSQQ